jgi:hypothetical protein
LNFGQIINHRLFVFSVSRNSYRVQAEIEFDTVSCDFLHNPIKQCEMELIKNIIKSSYTKIKLIFKFYKYIKFYFHLKYCCDV